MKYTFYIFFALLALVSCNEDMPRAYEAKPMAMARMNEIVVVSDDDLWEGPTRDTFNYYFQSAYPIMPSPEPMFDVRHFTKALLDGESLRKELRTYVVLADLSNSESPTTQMVRRDLGEERYLRAKNDATFNTSIGKDKWARKQILVYIFANGEKGLQEAIRKNYPSIAKRVRLHDKEQLDASIFAIKGQNPGLEKELAKEFGIKFKIPADFVRLKKEEPNFFWLKKDTKDAAINIIVKKYPYNSPDQITPENMVKLRDDYGAKHIYSSTPGSFMVSNTEDLPVYDYTYEIDGMYTKEIRGIWEMSSDYMGGPYASYLIQSPDKKNLIFIDTWVYSPGKDKRDYMLQLEHLVKSTKTQSELSD